MVLPTKQKFFEKFLQALSEDNELAKAYFERFGVVCEEKSSEEIVCQIIDKLSYYGGYEIRCKLIESIQVKPEDCVLDIGPETGMECFLLAEVYHKVLVAEPDTTTPSLLRGIAKHYLTEDGRKASDVLDIRRTGIIPPNSTWSRTDEDEKPSHPVSFDARGAPDISQTFGLNFADRIVCHHIGLLMPGRPQLAVLLSALSSYCTPRGIITYTEEVSELEGMVEEYLVSKGQRIRKHIYYWFNSLHPSLVKYHPIKIKHCMAELLPSFNISLRIFSESHYLTIAKHN